MEFTHFDGQGNAWMVDVGEKADTRREAVARGSIFMSSECFEMVRQGTMKKGDVLAVARVAGIMGAKRTSELIPLCHVLNLTKLNVDFHLRYPSRAEKGSSSTLAAMLVMAAAFLILARLLIKTGCRGRPVILKLCLARSVWTP